MAHGALKLAWELLKTDIDALLGKDTELQQRAEQGREAHHLVSMALRFEENAARRIAA